jgi:hypothetical protein
MFIAPVDECLDYFAAGFQIGNERRDAAFCFSYIQTRILAAGGPTEQRLAKKTPPTTSGFALAIRSCNREFFQ